jgi:hypothetical protein
MKKPIAVAAEPIEPELYAKARKMSRGSRRRIERAAIAFEAAIDAFCAEMDLQVFMADDAGRRVSPWPMLAKLRELQAELTKATGEIIN